MVGVADLGDGSGCGIALRDEDAGLFAFIELVLGEFVSVVVFAVAQLAVVDAGLLVALAGFFLDTGNLFPFGLGRFDLLLDNGDDLRMDAQVIVQVAGDEVVHEAADGGAVVLLLLPHVVGTQLGLGLAFEIRFLDLDADGAYQALPDIFRSVILLEEILERLGYRLSQGCQVGAAVAGVLAVDEGGNVLSVAAAMGKDHLDVFAFQVDEGIERRLGHVLVHEVQEAVFRFIGNPVQYQGQSFLEVGVILDQGLYILHLEMVVPEHQRIGRKDHQRAIFFVGGTLSGIDELAALVFGPGGLPVAERLDPVRGRKGVHRLGSHAVQTNGFLEVLVVELAAGVQLAGDHDNRAQRDAAAEIAHGNLPVHDVDEDLFAVSHRVFVDGIVYDFFDEHIDAVSLVVAVAEPPDIHAGPPADMFDVVEMPDTGLIVGMRVLCSHNSPLALYSAKLQKKSLTLP